VKKQFMHVRTNQPGPSTSVINFNQPPTESEAASPRIDTHASRPTVAQKVYGKKQPQKAGNNKPHERHICTTLARKELGLKSGLAKNPDFGSGSDAEID
jgi:hypothetical protein